MIGLWPISRPNHIKKLKFPNRWKRGKPREGRVLGLMGLERKIEIVFPEALARGV
jgi:hypothetical protein